MDCPDCGNRDALVREGGLVSRGFNFSPKAAVMSCRFCGSRFTYDPTQPEFIAKLERLEE